MIGSTGKATALLARQATIWLWGCVCLSLLAWIWAGYPRFLCVIAAAPLLVPLRGLLRGSRYTYAWATLFAIPYLMFVVTELLANPRARWVAASTLLLVFAWFCAMVAFLRLSRAPRE
jgi:uncharacterized membrane protein